MPIIAREQEIADELKFAAQMTEHQFAALVAKLHPTRIIAEVKSARRVTQPSLARSANLDEVSKWLLNGWNTENLLRLTSDILADGANAAALQWTFPQAYYSVYAVCFAFFNIAGFTERTHVGVIKKFGELVAGGDYPRTVSFYAMGRPNAVSFHNIQMPPLTATTTPLSFDASDRSSIDKHICQFLRGTRQVTLQEKRADFKFKTKTGARKKRLDAADWNRVAEAMGPTTLLSVLYRKRIKANYREIDTFTMADIDAAEVHKNALRVVTVLNFVHECYIAAAIGWSKFEEIAAAFLQRCNLERVARRLPHIHDVLGS
jgi:hypothetical protein